MKQTCGAVVAVCIVLGMWTSAWGQNAEEHRQLIEQVVNQIKSVLHADAVLGTPQEFQGNKIVPIVSLMFGFGSGSGVSTVDEERGRGAGGGGGITPTGLLVITPDGDVQVIAAKKGAFSEILKETLPAVIDAMQKKKREEE